MNKRINNLATAIMLVASLILVIIIYELVAAGSPDSVPVMLEVSSATDIDAHFSTSQLSLSTFSAATAATTTTTTAAPSDVHMVIVTGDAANIRAQASVDAAVLGIAYQGDSLQVIGEASDSGAVKWYRVEVGGVTGYVCSTTVAPDEEYYVKRAYLTFDDGPSQNTGPILDILDRYGVKATFFVIYHKGVDDLYRQIVERGHTIALHSYSHDYSNIYSSTDSYFADLSRLESHVSTLTGVSPRIIRFPGGSSNTTSRKYSRGIMTKLTAMVQERGYTYHDWNVDSGDADGVTVPKEKILETFKTELGTRSNATILMHDTSVKTTTVEALPEIIEYLLANGYAILPITQHTAPVHHSISN